MVALQKRQGLDTLWLWESQITNASRNGAPGRKMRTNVEKRRDCGVNAILMSLSPLRLDFGLSTLIGLESKMPNGRRRKERLILKGINADRKPINFGNLPKRLPLQGVRNQASVTYATKIEAGLFSIIATPVAISVGGSATGVIRFWVFVMMMLIFLSEWLHI